MKPSFIRAANAEFEVSVTVDGGIAHQQNLSELRLAIVILSPSLRRKP